FCFFSQAEDGIRDRNVTGVQTCALPILIFSFETFEDIIQVSSYLSAISIAGGQVYFMNGRYYMLLDDDDLQDQNKENIIAIMSEFSNPSIITSYRLKEYAKEIYASDAIKQIKNVFQ